MKLPVYLALSIAFCTCAGHEPGSSSSVRDGVESHARSPGKRIGRTVGSFIAAALRPRTFGESAYQAGGFLAWSTAARALALTPWEERDTGYQRRSVLEIATYLPPVQNLEVFEPQPLSTIEQCRPFVDPPTPTLEMFWRLPELRLLRWDDIPPEVTREVSAEDQARRQCLALASTVAVFDAAADLTDRLAAVIDNHRELDTCLDGIDDDIVDLAPGCKAMQGAIDMVDLFLDDDLDPRLRDTVIPALSCSGLGSYVPRPHCPLGAEDIWQVRAYREGLAWVRATLPQGVTRERERLRCGDVTGTL